MRTTQDTEADAAALPGWLASPWLRPLNDLDAIDGLLARLDPLWSLTRIRARILEIRRETRDTATFVLGPNRLWPGHRAGQFTTVEVEIHGRRHRRSFSLSSPPLAGGPVSVTVKRNPAGTVSRWMHDNLDVGDVLGLSAPAGAFTLPDGLLDDSPPALALVCAGSGITPMRSLLLDLRRRSYRGHIHLVHCARTEADAVFGAELRGLAAAWPRLTATFHYSADEGRLDAEGLTSLVSDLDARVGYLCGPAPFMADLAPAWPACNPPIRESFGGPAPPPAESGQSVVVVARRSGTSFQARAGFPLLAEAEAAGLNPKYGCRAGLCHTCVCAKVEGNTEDLLTGAISTEPEQSLRLCVSAARSGLILDL